MRSLEQGQTYNFVIGDEHYSFMYPNTIARDFVGEGMPRKHTSFVIDRIESMLNEEEGSRLGAQWTWTHAVSSKDDFADLTLETCRGPFKTRQEAVGEALALGPAEGCIVGLVEYLDPSKYVLAAACVDKVIVDIEQHAFQLGWIKPHVTAIDVAALALEEVLAEWAQKWLRSKNWRMSPTDWERVEGQVPTCEIEKESSS